MKYGLLEHHEKIKKGDEYFNYKKFKWIELKIESSMFGKDPTHQPGDWPVRRLLNGRL